MICRLLLNGCKRNNKRAENRCSAVSKSITYGCFAAVLAKQLSGYPYMQVETAQATDYDLLIVDQPQIAENYHYKSSWS